LPTYASGYFTSGYATKTFSPFKINAKKWNSLKIKTKYYNTDIHEGSFRNDNFVRTIIKTK
jgi:spermidine synthase